MSQWTIMSELARSDDYVRSSTMLSVRQYSAYGSQLSDDSDAYDADEAYVDGDSTASYSTEWYASSESIVVVSITVVVNATELAAGDSPRSTGSDDDDDGYCR